MNDPHVVSLTYRIDKADTVDFDKAPPLPVDRGAFRVALDAYTAKVEMVDHFASVAEARDTVEPFLRAWELSADLRAPDERFRFVYETAQVVDPSPLRTGAGAAVGATFGLSVAFGVSHTSRATWPEPPQNLSVSPDADVMWRRWLSFRFGREKLLPAAYWALTIVEAAPQAAAPNPRRISQKRRDASKVFNVDLDVLKQDWAVDQRKGRRG